MLLSVNVQIFFLAFETTLLSEHKQTDLRAVTTVHNSNSKIISSRLTRRPRKLDFQFPNDYLAEDVVFFLEIAQWNVPGLKKNGTASLIQDKYAASK